MTFARSRFHCLVTFIRMSLSFVISILSPLEKGFNVKNFIPMTFDDVQRRRVSDWLLLGCLEFWRANKNQSGTLHGFLMVLRHQDFFRIESYTSLSRLFLARLIWRYMYCVRLESHKYTIFLDLSFTLKLFNFLFLFFNNEMIDLSLKVPRSTNRLSPMVALHLLQKK